MRFINKAKRLLDFDLDGNRYKVEPGGSCDIPDHVAYAVKLHRLPLVEESEVKPSVVTKGKPGSNGQAKHPASN